MSELALKMVVDQVVRNLEQREFPIFSVSKRSVEATGTSGFWCKVYSVGTWSLEIWLDRWMHTDAPEFYYGFSSTRKNEVDRFISLFRDSEPFFEIRSDQEEKFEGDQTRLKRAVAVTLGHRMMSHYHKGRCWFGKYAKDGRAVEEATVFCLTILQEVGPLSFREGACGQITTNRRERSSEARRLCLQKFGHRCRVCGFDFEEQYGSEIGAGFIHVHHVIPLAGGERGSNPEVDLIPVCPNCHGMLHRRDPPLRPDELRHIMEQQRKTKSEI